MPLRYATFISEYNDTHTIARSYQMPDGTQRIVSRVNPYTIEEMDSSADRMAAEIQESITRNGENSSFGSGILGRIRRGKNKNNTYYRNGKLQNKIKL